jgi:hypothetical protein
MKNLKVLLIVVFLLSSAFSLQQAAAQEKAKSEQEKEQQILKTIEEQKKAMADQKKAQEEANASLKEQKEDMDDVMKDVQVNVEAAAKAGSGVRIYGQRGNRVFDIGEPFVFSGQDIENFYGHFGGDTERTTWDFSKSVKENTFSKEYSFDVEKTAKNVVMSVMGDCKAGDIHIKIVMPNGKNYSDIVIDEFGNLNWRKTFTITETENQDKAGEWKFQISSTKATGYFKISLQTY